MERPPRLVNVVEVYATVAWALAVGVVHFDETHVLSVDILGEEAPPRTPLTAMEDVPTSNDHEGTFRQHRGPQLARGKTILHVQRNAEIDPTDCH